MGGRLVLFAAAACLLAAGSAAVEVYPFEPFGAIDPLANGIHFELTGYSANTLFVTTVEGFHAYDFATGVWTDHTHPGSIGMTRTAVLKLFGLPDRIVLGGVNAFFKGTLWYSDDGGATQFLTRESTGGAVTDLAQRHSLVDPLIYACTWSDVVPGELLRSLDHGLTWIPVTGHGHHVMTAVALVADDEVYVAGDNYVTRTFDHGATWENLQANLPAGEGLYCLLVHEPVTTVPKQQSRDAVDQPIWADYLMVANDSGVYVCVDPSAVHWQRVLPHACRAFAARFVSSGSLRDLTLYYDENWAVTFDGRLLYCEDRNWDDWLDVTALIAPAVPIDVTEGYDGVYVLTRDHGVYRSDGGVPPWTSTPDLPPPLSLVAAPNPFNPRTTVSFTLPQAGLADVSVYDLAGRRLATLAREHLTAGLHTRVWDGIGPDGRALPSGAYLLRLQAGGEVTGKKLSLVR